MTIDESQMDLRRWLEFLVKLKTRAVLMSFLSTHSGVRGSARNEVANEGREARYATQVQDPIHLAVC